MMPRMAHPHDCPKPPADRSRLTRFAWLSMAAAVLTMGLKVAAWLLTGSVGLLSDALESLVNMAGALMALLMLSVAARPPDDDHAYGHGKAEYFSSGVEGALILLAAIGIAWAAIPRLIHPRLLEQVGMGLGVSAVAALVNGGVAVALLRAGRKYRSITLEANAQHLLTDVWTSVGVLAGVGVVALTGWERLDPILALLVAANIVRAGVGIIHRSAMGLMDTALPAADVKRLKEILDRLADDGVHYHALRTRQAGARRFVAVHILVPGEWSVQRGHALLEVIEADVRQLLPGVTVLTHLEPEEDPTSWDDQELDREARAASDASGPVAGPGRT